MPNRLETLFARIPLSMQKEMEKGYSSFTPEDWTEQGEWLLADPWRREAAWKEYLEIIREDRAKLREYLKREKRERDLLARNHLPRVPVGAPRQDTFAAEAMELKKSGLSYSKIAIRHNQANRLKPGEKGYATKESVRKLIKRRENCQSSPPDKIRN